MSKYALPALGRSAGTIVNIASYVGLVGFHGAAAYAASKAALVSLTRCTALDHAHEGGRVNCVCPGSVDTDMIHQAWRRHGNIEEAHHVWAAKHPLGRMGTPEEGARALFLASGGQFHQRRGPARGWWDRGHMRPAPRSTFDNFPATC